MFYLSRFCICKFLFKFAVVNSIARLRHCKQLLLHMAEASLCKKYCRVHTTLKWRSIWTSISILLMCVFCISLSSCRSSRAIQYDSKQHAIDEIHVNKPTRNQRKIVDEAYTWLGTPYKYAHQEKGEGTDCSGMVMMVYVNATGEKLPRNSAKQAEFCIDASPEEVNAGDLVFFATGRDPVKVSHVGIVVDDDNFIHASSSKGVIVSKLSSPYFKRTFIKFGRVPKLSTHSD